MSGFTTFGKKLKNVSFLLSTPENCHTFSEANDSKLVFVLLFK